MEWIVSNRKRQLTIAVLVAVAAFSTVFLLTGAIMTQVYGIKPGDPEFTIYTKPDGTAKTPYDNFITNGCMTKTFYDGDKTLILDTKGVEELGLFYYDPNVCFDIAKQTTGYEINKVESYKITTPGLFGTEKDMMKITLVKKP